MSSNQQHASHPSAVTNPTQYLRSSQIARPFRWSANAAVLLAALALSQQRRRPWLPLIGIVVTLILTPGFIALGLPLLTAPFILACWLVQSSVRVLRPAAAKSEEQCRLRIER